MTEKSGTASVGSQAEAAGKRVHTPVPLVGLIRNPRSHRNKNLAPELAECPNILTETPVNHQDLRDALARFAERGIDYLAVDGGDGTVRDVLSSGADIFGETWPELIILPRGKTNALTVDLGLPRVWSLSEAVAAAGNGARVERRPLLVRPQDGDGKPLLGFMFGAGVFSLGVDAGQDAHRLGAFNSFAVGVSIGWGILQSLLGTDKTRWRQRTPMRFVHAESGEALPHGPHGREGERYVVMATTFENFPLGVRPFGSDVEPGLKLAIIDAPVRWLIALLPAILVGFYPRFVASSGAHRVKAQALDMELGGNFILDGESYPAGRYRLGEGPLLRFVVP